MDKKDESREKEFKELKDVRRHYERERVTRVDGGGMTGCFLVFGGFLFFGLGF